METKQFFFKGKEFIITLNGMGLGSTVEVIYPGNSNKYVYKLGHEVRMNEISKYVYVTYEEQVLDIDGDYLKGGMYEFPATTQETFSYFYNMMIGTATIGTTLTKMIIDGFLIDKYELQQGVFGNDGNFYYPTWFNHQIETFSTEVVNDEGEPETVYDYNITINVQDKVEGEVYNYTLINTGVSQTSNVFTQLPAGTYTIMAESPLSMPYYETIVIPEGYIIPTAL